MLARHLSRQLSFHRQLSGRNLKLNKIDNWYELWSGYDWQIYPDFDIEAAMSFKAHWQEPAIPDQTDLTAIELILFITLLRSIMPLQ